MTQFRGDPKLRINDKPIFVAPKTKAKNIGSPEFMKRPNSVKRYAMRFENKPREIFLGTTMPLVTRPKSREIVVSEQESIEITEEPEEISELLETGITPSDPFSTFFDDLRGWGDESYAELQNNLPPNNSIYRYLLLDDNVPTNALPPKEESKKKAGHKINMTRLYEMAKPKTLGERDVEQYSLMSKGIVGSQAMYDSDDDNNSNLKLKGKTLAAFHQDSNKQKVEPKPRKISKSASVLIRRPVIYRPEIDAVVDKNISLKGNRVVGIKTQDRAKTAQPSRSSKLLPEIPQLPPKPVREIPRSLESWGIVKGIVSDSSAGILRIQKKESELVSQIKPDATVRGPKKLSAKGFKTVCIGISPSAQKENDISSILTTISPRNFQQQEGLINFVNMVGNASVRTYNNASLRGPGSFKSMIRNLDFKK